MLGRELDRSILDARLAAFVPSLLLTALFFGGNESPGGAASPCLAFRIASRPCGPRWCSARSGRPGTRPSCSPPMMQAAAWAPAACSCSPRSRCSASSGRWTTRALRERLKRRMHLVRVRTMARNRIHVGAGSARAGRRTTVSPKRDQLEFTRIGLLTGDQLRRKAAAVLAAT